jgi:hypothetical protein
MLSVTVGLRRPRYQTRLSSVRETAVSRHTAPERLDRPPGLPRGQGDGSVPPLGHPYRPPDHSEGGDRGLYRRPCLAGLPMPYFM